MRSGMFDALDIEGLEISDVIREPGQYSFLANLIDGRTHPCCEQAEGNVTRWGSPQRRFRDLTMHGKFVEIIVHPQEFRCNACRKTFREEIPGLHDNHRMTTRLVDRIIQQAGRRTFAQTAQEVGISTSSARRVFVANMVDKMKQYDFEMPRVLGIDGKYIKGNYITIIGDIEKRVFLDMVGSTDVEVMREYFRNRSNHERVEVITADMERTFRDIADEFFPKAVVVIDKYHVVKTANEAMDRLRIDIGKKQDEETRLWYKKKREHLLTRRWKIKVDSEASENLKRMFSEQPRLEMAYEIKEGMFDIYKAKDRRDAEQRYIEWRKSMPISMKQRFSSLPTAMKTKAKFIFNYFDHRYTNAYVESLNRQIADLHRDGRGYGFDILRAKAYVAYGPNRYRPVRFSSNLGRFMTDYEFRDLFESMVAFNPNNMRAATHLRIMRRTKPWLFTRRKRDREMQKHHKGSTDQPKSE